MKRTNLFVTERQHTHLSLASKSHGVTVSELVRRAIDRFITPQEDGIRLVLNISAEQLAADLVEKGFSKEKADLAVSTIDQWIKVKLFN